MPISPCRILAALVLTLAVVPLTTAAADELTDAERRAVVDRLGAMLQERYVFADVGEQCAERIAAELAAGAWGDVRDPEAFAMTLTESLQSVSHDKHMRVRVRPAERVAVQRDDPLRARTMQLDRMRRDNFGFERVERLDGNIGYLDLRYFAGSPLARETAAAAMGFLANADALIFDMRRNGGGSPEMIRFVCSYLFDEPTHLNSLYWREGDRTDEFWTLPEVPGRKLADVPCFVLTSSYTFSGAEEFTYNLKTRERATIIGETTGGGANPGGTVPVSERFEVFIPTGRAINPVTGTNWEGVGVSPDIAVDADEALEVALERAREAAEHRRAARQERLDEVWSTLGAAQRRVVEAIEQGRVDDAAKTLVDAVRRAHALDLIGEMEINGLGYEHLGAGRADLAVAIFRLNTELYPESSNAWDSLGEACMTAGETKDAIRFYRRSLELDPDNANAEEMIRRMEASGSSGVRERGLATG